MKFSGKSNVMKIITMVSCLVVILTMSIPLGCGKTENTVTFPVTLKDLPFVQIWNEVLNTMDIQDQSADLQYLSLHADKTDESILLSFDFLGVNDDGDSKYYSVSVSSGGNSEGKLQQYSGETDIPAAASQNHPLVYFEELDKVKLESIATGEDGFYLLLTFQRGNFGLSREYDAYDIYHLDGGNLTPMDRISFDTEKFVGSIMISLIQKTQVWFITEDIEKATTVEYL